MITLPTSDNRLEAYRVTGTPLVPRPPKVQLTRTAFAAAHVISDPIAERNPWDTRPAVDWDATLAFRQDLWDQGLGLAEAMDISREPEQVRERYGKGDTAKYGDGEVDVRAETRDGDLHMQIDDNGRGFGEGSTERLLERGVRADTSREGQGLGLAVAAEIVRSYTGDIILTRCEKGGARVEIVLPAE